MRQFRAALPRPVHAIACTIPDDFDDIEAAEQEIRREILHGHAPEAHMQVRPVNHKIYSL